jgi:hypothetical protein
MQSERIISPTGRDSPPLVLGRQSQGVADPVGYAFLFGGPTHGPRSNDGTRRGVARYTARFAAIHRNAA